ncbi:hypothetical protein ACTWQB_15860 [Piscibacillus sp. B03]|uniref:hypothetical protein n=1 Tax=Piscibacillus sp. B03 TaxID=3457430 RepID=UPI003FCE6A46
MKLQWLEEKIVNEEVKMLFEQSFEYIPYLGSVLQNVKMNRFQRRLKEESYKINNISKLMAETNLANEYITERIFPIVLSDMIEEHEDAKFNLILNGFLNVFIEEEHEESILLTHFDTLRSIRYMDFRRLSILSYRPISEEFPLENNIAITKRIDNKLVTLGLIAIPTYFGEMDMLNDPNKVGDIQLTPYGKEFLNFITEDKVDF